MSENLFIRIVIDNSKSHREYKRNDPSKEYDKTRNFLMEYKTRCKVYKSNVEQYPEECSLNKTNKLFNQVMTNFYFIESLSGNDTHKKHRSRNCKEEKIFRANTLYGELNVWNKIGYETNFTCKKK